MSLPPPDTSTDPGTTASSRGPGRTSSPRGRLPPPERRRRGDLVAVALLVLVAVIGAVLVLRAGDEADTAARTAPTPLRTPADGPVPTTLVEAWRAPSPATPTPLVVGPAVVTAGPDAADPDPADPAAAGTVVGHDALTGSPAWSYRRPEPLCTAAAGFGTVLAVFRTEGPLGVYCSDVASLTPDTGARGPARNADLRPGTRLLSDRSHVTGTGRDYLETWRSDLVMTMEYGAVPTPVQPPSAQPRSACTRGSVAVGGDRVAAVERCPGEESDRLTVLDADPQTFEKPEERASTLTGVRGALAVAVTDGRAAYAAPDGTLRVVDDAGTPVASYPLGPVAGPTADPPGLAAATRTAGPVLLWWTGTGTVGLDPTDLRPRWTLPGTLGTGVTLPGSAGAGTATLLVPVRGGLAVVDAATGAVRSTVAVSREDPTAPVGTAAIGPVVVEQRGDTVVALRPPGVR